MKLVSSSHLAFISRLLARKGIICVAEQLPLFELIVAKLTKIKLWINAYRRQEYLRGCFDVSGCYISRAAITADPDPGWAAVCLCYRGWHSSCHGDGCWQPINSNCWHSHAHFHSKWSHDQVTGETEANRWVIKTWHPIQVAFLLCFFIILEVFLFCLN